MSAVIISQGIELVVEIWQNTKEVRFTYTAFTGVCLKRKFTERYLIQAKPSGSKRNIA